MERVSPGCGRMSRRDARRQRGRAEGEMDERVGAQRLDHLHAAGEGMPLARRHEMLGADADDHFAAVEATGASGGVGSEAGRCSPPSNTSSPPRIMPLAKFMAGEPMKPPTKTLAGVL